jgi:hypothetical protein
MRKDGEEFSRNFYWDSIWDIKYEREINEIKGIRKRKY